MRDRLPGILLFLPVPMVLVLFTRAPLGAGWSLALGAALMVTHRFYARPWSLNRAGRRCLWCAGEGSDLEPIVVAEPGGASTWAVHPGHRDLLARTLGAAAGMKLYLRALILLALVVLFAASVGGEHGIGSAAFRVIVALAVLPLGGWGPRWKAREAPTVPFPVHIQALIGTRAVLWLFRIIGLIWLVMGTADLVRA